MLEGRECILFYHSNVNAKDLDSLPSQKLNLPDSVTIYTLPLLGKCLTQPT